ncbi:MAG: energy transducer TonB [Cyanobacteria bacterium]|nr:energy transducer TonB [Cyanobacteriota bacterium]
MAKATGNKAPALIRGSQLRLDDRPEEYSFGFESAKSKVGAGTSVLTHIALIAVVLLIIRFAPQALPPEIADQLDINMAVFLPTPGPGGGGGGGGDPKPEPPRKAQVEKKVDPISVPAPVTPTPTPPKVEEPPPLEMVVPFKPMSEAEMTLPGVISPSAPTTGGAGSGPGTGAGSGQGSGLGPGFGGGFGGGAFRPGSGVTLPTVLREVKPAYTADAMRAKVQGSVWLECIVMPDGSVGDVKVTRSLDPIFGLDQEAIKAAKMWKFRPGMRQGEPVPVIITIELTFTLR